MHPASRPLLAPLLALLTCLAAPSGVQATPNERDNAAKPAKTKPSRAATPKVIPSGSEETSRERERRLLRECKGRPNAGACSGYAS